MSEASEARVRAASEARVRDLVLAHLADEIAAFGLAPGTLQDDFDLLGEGLLDSFGLLELIGSIELTLGLTLDFDDLDVGSLTVLGPFCRHVAGQLHGAAASSVLGIAPSVDTAPDLTDDWPVRITPPTGKPMTPFRRVAGSCAIGFYRSLVRGRGKIFALAIAGSFSAFGVRTVLQPPLRLSGQERIALGSGIFIGAGSWLNVLEGSGRRVAIEIGDGTAIAGLCVLSSVQSIRIGRSVSMARNVYVADHAHAYDRSTRPILEQGITDVQPVEIGDGAWLGQNVVVLPGTRVGQGAVIGANSVVHGDIPPYSVAIGSPARVIRRFSPRSDVDVGRVVTPPP